MQVSKISFGHNENKNTTTNNKKQPALYSKDGYMRMVNTTRFGLGSAVTYGILETIDKISIAKNSKKLAKDKLISQAHKGKKRNILIGIASGVLSIIAGKIMDKKLIPFTEKIYEKVNKFEEINKKAKELVEQEEKDENFETDKKGDSSEKTDIIVKNQKTKTEKNENENEIEIEDKDKD